VKERAVRQFQRMEKRRAAPRIAPSDFAAPFVNARVRKAEADEIMGAGGARKGVKFAWAAPKGGVGAPEVAACFD
jgi:hypothetical protein